MSKNQQKKLQKKLDWESKRDERKVIRKQKLVAKRERKRAARAQAIENGDSETQPTSQPKTWQKPVLLPITVLIDCDFDDLMRDPERKSLAAQITRSYSDNRKAPFRSHLAICSFGGQLRERFDNVLTHYKSWRGVKFLDCDFVEAAQQAKGWMIESQQAGKMAGVFSKLSPPPENSVDHAKLQDQAEVVYLTSESDNTLTELKPYSTYIIGGLVDKNREKGICYKRATQRGIKTAKLPIGEFMDMRSRKVLATNHVNEIMVRWLECGDWGEAFLKVIPKRKGGKLKQAAENDDSIEDLEQDDHGEDDLDLERANDEDIMEDAGDNHEESPSSTQGRGDSDASRKD
jgi:tRNA (guanine9-N1)-methyltransferase